MRFYIQVFQEDWHSVLTTEIVCDANLALEERIASFEFIHRKIKLEGLNLSEYR